MARQAVGDTGRCEQEKPLGLCLMIRRGVRVVYFQQQAKIIFFCFVLF